MSGTLSSTRPLDDESGAVDAVRAPQLHLVLTYEAPCALPLRLDLRPFERVVLGRGHARAISTEPAGGALSASVQLVDPWLSTTHCELSRVGGGWLVEDRGSRNGTALDGQPLTGRAPLADGALLEIGHTFLLYREAAPLPPDHELLAGVPTGSSALACQLRDAARIAPTRVPVLLLGESGTGKELVARAIHAASRRGGPFVAVNCGALPATLVEAELFGHKRGAFTGATDDRAGLVRESDGGTLLLDEIGDLPLAAQASLLRVLQESEVVPVGGARPVRVDLRILAATHRDLPALVAAGRFREDLYARLDGLVVRLPPLRERREDIGPLACEMLGRAGATRAVLRPEAIRALLAYPWPLNVRELERCLATAVALAEGAEIGVAHLSPAVRDAWSRRLQPAAAAPPARDDALRAELVARLAEHAGNVSAVARAMGKGRTQIQRWMRRLGVDAGARARRSG